LASRRVQSGPTAMRKVQVLETGRYSHRDQPTVVNTNELPAGIIWIMIVTALATFGVLVAGYELLFCR
jgi:hypothetical protein